MKLKPEHHARGFTLIEIVITITITAILSTMIFTYFGKVFTESVTPITRLKSAEALQRVMENITADYNVYPKWKSGTNYASGGYVIPTNFNGHYYRSSGGTSGSNEPNWPTGSSGTVPDNTITWTETGRLRETAPPNGMPLLTLKSNIGVEGSLQSTNPYGLNPDGITYATYTVDKNNFIKFVNDMEQDIVAGDAENILKVTLRNDSGETMTALFVSD
jgi:prepilin-type N-terminal cleavage/methylation domain-containing protein